VRVGDFRVQRCKELVLQRALYLFTFFRWKLREDILRIQVPHLVNEPLAYVQGQLPDKGRADVFTLVKMIFI